MGADDAIGTDTYFGPIVHADDDRSENDRRNADVNAHILDCNLMRKEG